MSFKEQMLGWTLSLRGCENHRQGGPRSGLPGTEGSPMMQCLVPKTRKVLATPGQAGQTDRLYSLLDSLSTWEGLGLSSERETTRVAAETRSEEAVSRW